VYEAHLRRMIEREGLIPFRSFGFHYHKFLKEKMALIIRNTTPEFKLTVDYLEVGDLFRFDEGCDRVMMLTETHREIGNEKNDFPRAVIISGRGHTMGGLLKLTWEQKIIRVKPDNQWKVVDA